MKFKVFVWVCLFFLQFFVVSSDTILIDETWNSFDDAVWIRPANSVVAGGSLRMTESSLYLNGSNVIDSTGKNILFITNGSFTFDSGGNYYTWIGKDYQRDYTGNAHEFYYNYVGDFYDTTPGIFFNQPIADSTNATIYLKWNDSHFCGKVNESITYGCSDVNAGVNTSILAGVIMAGSGATVDIHHTVICDDVDNDWACTPAAPEFPPQNSSWNFTATTSLFSGEDGLAWNFGGVINASANNGSLTVTASENSNLSCAIGKNYNHTTMITYQPFSKAATTDTQSHAYIIYDNMTDGSNCLYCSLIDSNGNEYANSTSGCLQINLIQDSCTCPFTGGIDCSDNCNITNCDMQGGNINIFGAGAINLYGAITNVRNITGPNDCLFNEHKGSNITHIS